VVFDSFGTVSHADTIGADPWSGMKLESGWMREGGPASSLALPIELSDTSRNTECPHPRCKAFAWRHFLLVLTLFDLLDPVPAGCPVCRPRAVPQSMPDQGVPAVAVAAARLTGFGRGVELAQRDVDPVRVQEQHISAVSHFSKIRSAIPSSAWGFVWVPFRGREVRLELLARGTRSSLRASSTSRDTLRPTITDCP